MAFVVEDGTGLATANSYGAVADADAYFSDRGNGQWAALTSTQKQGNLVQATDYIDAFYGAWFIGTETTTTQALEWPRTGAEGFASNEIPSDLKKATYEYAYRASKAPLMPDPIVPGSGVPTVTTYERVGEIERRYAQVAGSQTLMSRPYPAADLLLQDLLRPGYGGDRVIR